jgi:hypothetical protein
MDAKNIKNEQIKHYYELLNQGLDCRKEGLIWIIKNLWFLNENVAMSSFPDFLDTESIKYLLEYAKLDIKKNEINKVLKDGIMI